MKSLYNIQPKQVSGLAHSTGWIPPMPDLRDYSSEHESIKQFAKRLGLDSKKIELEQSIDLRSWCSPVEDQGNIGSCTAQAAVGIVEYYERKAFNKHIEGSRMFLYKTTRNLMQSEGDSGAWIRSTMGALLLCGLPDEKYWPYVVENYDNEPDAFVYSVANNYKPSKYFCHDPAGSGLPYPDVLLSVKTYLAAGIPSMFGFWGFPSFDKSNVKGGIPFPCNGESARWGHAVAAVGYNDLMKIRNTSCGRETTGALLIRNSWGEAWGDKGYGWLPYEYVLSGFASDFWSLLGLNWLDTNQFGL